MTLINCISGAIYTKGLAVKDKVQIYGTALIFLVLLYNSPSGLVLYWTLNNVFSLVKNILAKIKHAKQWVYGILCAGAAMLDGYVLFFHPGYLPKRLFTAGILSIVFFIPLLVKIPAFVSHKIGSRCVTRNPSYNHRCFVLSLLILLSLAGLIVPGALAASSVEEFSFIEAYASPFPFIFHAFLQGAGIFLFWPLCIYLLFPFRIRQILSLCLTILSFWAFLNVFLVNENFGFLTNTLIFSEPKSFAAGNMGAYVFNMAILAAAASLILYLIFTGKKVLLFSFQAITIISLLCFGTITLIKINGEYNTLKGLKETTSTNTNNEDAYYTLSKDGKNVLLIMLDAAVSGYVPYIFEEKPELTSDFEDFTWYPNCVSFAGHTLVGAPPLYGGYEYTPEEINRRDSVPLAEKHQEAYLLLPRIFSETGYSVTITDPPFDNYRMTNLSIFADYPQIHVENILGKYTSRWFNTHPDVQVQGVNITALLQRNLIRFSIFKMTPIFIRSFIYDGGDWLSTSHLNTKNKVNIQDELTSTIINDYAFMDLLPELTTTTGTGNTYTAIYAHLPHDTAFLQFPGYIPSNTITDHGNGPFADDSKYHVNIASLLLLGKFFRFLRDEGIYDNTRIILVADHGSGYSDYENNITLPNGSRLQSYRPLLMVKDFSSDYDEQTEKKLNIDSSFMTNADAIFFALKDIVENPINPFTNQRLQPQKAGGANIVTIGALNSYRHTKYKYNIGKDQWLHVHTNIFDPANWKKLE
jgi:hypothetical protein